MMHYVVKKHVQVTTDRDLFVVQLNNLLWILIHIHVVVRIANNLIVVKTLVLAGLVVITTHVLLVLNQSYVIQVGKIVNLFVVMRISVHLVSAKLVSPRSQWELNV
jgi:hypothetical protein